ncbi:MAG: hypothetical protein R3E10_00590 [Gemmatimonadota bacterium]
MTDADAPVRVGVTGHRTLHDLVGSQAELLRERVRALLVALAEERVGTLVSPLAEGADRIVAEEALALGYRLEVILPFAAESYERDFRGPASVDAFRALLERAAHRASLDRDATDSATRAAAYEAVGDALIESTDLLIALWDGDRERGRGGTGQVVRRALRAGLPVLHVASTTPFPIRLLMEDPGAGSTVIEGLVRRGVVDLPSS